MRIRQGLCIEVQTEDFKFFNCTDYTNYDYSTCSVQTITPQFALSTQVINPATVRVTVPPAKGTVTIDAGGLVTYSANPNEAGTDTFKFTFCGIGAIPDFEVAQATIQLNQVVSYNVTFKGCSETNTANFNLTEALVTPDLTAQKKYYKDKELTLPIPTDQLTGYAGVDGDLIYVYIKNSFGCYATATIELKTVAPVIVNENLYTKSHCDEDIDGILDGNYKVNVNTITPFVVVNTAGLTVLYYNDPNKANAFGTDNIIGNFTFSASDNEIWIRVEPNTVCPPIIRKIILNIGEKITLENPVSTVVCDNDLDDDINVDVAAYVSLFNPDSGVSVKYFDDLLKSQRGIATDELSGDPNISGNKTFYYRLKKAEFCEAIGTLNIIVKKPKKSQILIDQEICSQATTTLETETDFDGYVWSFDGQTTSSIINVPVGEYWVDLYFNGCVYRQYVSVKAVELPKITSIEIKGSTVTINVSGGNAPYQYALDEGNYQNSNVFANVPGGDHSVYIISADLCEPVLAKFNVIQLFNVITPNDDGLNDIWNTPVC